MARTVVAEHPRDRCCLHTGRDFGQQHTITHCHSYVQPFAADIDSATHQHSRASTNLNAGTYRHGGHNPDFGRDTWARANIDSHAAAKLDACSVPRAASAASRVCGAAASGE